ncbi:hypothetical protein LguiB_012194 [Lonicera macranthoides]
MNPSAAKKIVAVAIPRIRNPSATITQRSLGRFGDRKTSPTTSFQPDNSSFICA